MSSRDELNGQITQAMQLVIASSVLNNERIARDLGLSAVDLQTFGVVLRSAEPLTPGEVSAATLLPSSSTTRVLDRLEKAGFISRSHDAVDRRRVLVSAAPDRLGELMAHYEPIVASMTSLHEGFTDDELAIIARYLGALAEL